jgi:hypothetical protein
VTDRDRKTHIQKHTEENREQQRHTESNRDTDTHRKKATDLYLS